MTLPMYRYTLYRELAGLGRPVLFVMLNPSTADVYVDDPTIRRCMGFGRREAAAHINVVNLYPLRATDPKELRVAPISPEAMLHNTEILKRYLAAQKTPQGHKIVCAWGAHSAAIELGGVSTFVRIWEEAGKPDLWCLGTTQQGAPRHPLYVKGDAPLIPFVPKAGER